MVLEIPQGIDTLNFYEFDAPSFNEHGYHHHKTAHFRAYNPSKFLKSFIECHYAEAVVVPTKLEVMTESGEWKQHPVVFVQKNNAGTEDYLVIYCYGGKAAAISCTDFGYLCQSILKEAKKKNLDQGSRDNIAFIVDEK